MSGINFNPQLVVNAPGTFNASAIGLIQGTAYPDPETRYALAGGTLASTETLPMWGGVGIYNNVGGNYTASSLGPRNSLGTVVGRATALTGTTALTGFSVFDQNYSAINFPQSPVPLSNVSMQVNYYLLGSGARIAVACTPALVNLQGELITTDVSWDFGNQQLTAYSSSTLTSGPASYPTAATISSGTYTSATGVVSLTTNAAHGLAAGYTFTLTSMTGTGANVSALNGTFVATTGTAGSTLNFTIASGLVISTITGGDLGQVGVQLTTTAGHNLLPGDTFELSSLTGTGASQLDGEWVAQAGTTGTTLTFSATSGYTITSITGGTVATGGILPVKVLDVQIANCMTVNYNSTSGQASWNYNGACAVILI